MLLQGQAASGLGRYIETAPYKATGLQPSPKVFRSEESRQVIILRRKRVALEAVLAPFIVLLLLFVVRVSRPESGILQSLSAVYQKSPFAMIWPIAGLAVTVLICLSLWRGRQTPVPR